MTDIRAQIEADQERHDSAVRNSYPRHHATALPLFGTRLTATPWKPEITAELLGWHAFCSCSPSTVAWFPPDREKAAHAWRCPRSWKRTQENRGT